MPLLNVFEVSGSAMAAQSVRLNTTASNIANAESVAVDPANTYRARHPVFAQQLARQINGPGEAQAGAGGGVQIVDIVESGAPLDYRYEPEHPYANEEGFVAYPNVSVVEEMANMISASRSFELNVEIMNTARTLAERVLSMGQ